MILQSPTVTYNDVKVRRMYKESSILLASFYEREPTNSLQKLVPKKRIEIDSLSGVVRRNISPHYTVKKKVQLGIIGGYYTSFFTYVLKAGCALAGPEYR